MKTNREARDHLLNCRLLIQKVNTDFELMITVSLMTVIRNINRILCCSYGFPLHAKDLYEE